METLLKQIDQRLQRIEEQLARQQMGNPAPPPPMTAQQELEMLQLAGGDIVAHLKAKSKAYKVPRKKRGGRA